MIIDYSVKNVYIVSIIYTHGGETGSTGIIEI